MLEEASVGVGATAARLLRIIVDCTLCGTVRRRIVDGRGHTGVVAIMARLL
jgi:hypothetical protein